MKILAFPAPSHHTHFQDIFVEDMSVFDYHCFVLNISLPSVFVLDGYDLRSMLVLAKFFPKAESVQK